MRYFESIQPYHCRISNSLFENSRMLNVKSKSIWDVIWFLPFSIVNVTSGKA